MDLKEEGGSVEADDRKHDPKRPRLTTAEEERRKLNEYLRVQLLEFGRGMYDPLRPKVDVIGYRVEMTDEEKKNWKEFLDLDQKMFPGPRKPGQPLSRDEIAIENHNKYPFVDDLVKFADYYSNKIFTTVGVHQGIQMIRVVEVKYTRVNSCYAHYIHFEGKEKGIPHVIEGGLYRATVQTLQNNSRTLVALFHPVKWQKDLIKEKKANDKDWSDFLTYRAKDMVEARRKDADARDYNGVSFNVGLRDYSYFNPKKEYFPFPC